MRFLADENFNNHILRALLREDAAIDIVRVQDVEIYQTDDPTVLEWAAQHGRVILTRDVTTMSDYAYERVRQGKPMSGVIQIRKGTPIKKIVEEILVIAGASQPDELEGQVIFVPL